jgi:hypothetical protein
METSAECDSWFGRAPEVNVIAAIAIIIAPLNRIAAKVASEDFSHMM